MVALNVMFCTGGYYTKNGTMTNWWSNDTLKNYGEAQKCVIDSFANKTLGPFTIPGKTVTVRILIYINYNGIQNIYVFLSALLSKYVRR